MIFRIASDWHDKVWYVRAATSAKAVGLIRREIKELAWETSPVYEENSLEVEEVFTEPNEIMELEEM